MDGGESTIGVIPVKDNVIIEPLKEGDTFEGSMIIIPDAYKRLYQRGRVVAIGPGREMPDGTRVKPDVQLGECVGYTGEWQGEAFEIDGKLYRGLENEQIAFAFTP